MNDINKYKIDDEEVSTIMYRVLFDESLEIGLAPEIYPIIEEILHDFSSIDNASITTLETYLRKRIREKFTFIDEPPFWMLEPNWQYTSDGTPMIYVGRLKKLGMDDGGKFTGFPVTVYFHVFMYGNIPDLQLKVVFEEFIS
jgi:hypothetical protein